MLILTEATPNPQAQKFIFSKTLVGEGSVWYDIDLAVTSNDFIKQLFRVAGVRFALLQETYVTVTKYPQWDWSEITPKIKSALTDKSVYIEAGETDKPSRLKGFVSGMGSKISGLASSLNPFGSGFAFGNIGRILLAGGGIALIRNFGEQFIDPLADMLQEISDKGFKKTLIGIKDNIKERLEPTLAEMKLAFGNFMDAIGRSITFVKSIYTMINDYIMSFDTKGTIVAGGPLKGTVMGDGKLDMEELDMLKEDMQKKSLTILT